jgi:integrase
MVIRMPSPAERHGSTYIQFRQRVPADCLGRGHRHPLVIEFPATQVDPAHIVTASIGIREVTFSLRTRDPVTAKARQGIALAQFHAACAAMRQGPVSLSHRQCVALAGEVYRRFIDAHSDNPAPAEVWTAVKGLNRLIIQGRRAAANASVAVPALGLENAALTAQHAASVALIGPRYTSFTDAIDACPVAPEWPVSGGLEDRFGSLTDYVLGVHSLVIDAGSRERLLMQVAEATSYAARQLRRNADGDYAADPVALRFPVFQSQARPSVSVSSAAAGTLVVDGPTWDDIYDAWAAKHIADRGAAPTRPYVKSFLDRFAAWAGKPPAAITDADFQGWCDKRVNDDGVSPRTVSGKDMAFLRTAFKIAKARRLLPTIPSGQVVLPRIIKPVMKGYTNEQAVCILTAAKAADDPRFRWLPWLCALSGSRVSAVANLRAGDVKLVDDVWCLDINEDASKAVKTAASCRVVPLHPELVAQGFVTFAQSVADRASPLFFERKRDHAARHNPGEATTAAISAWVHRLKVQGVGRKHKVDPSHAWRHWFKSAARTAGLERGVVDRLVGHEPGVQERYGEYAIATLAAAVVRIAAPTPSTVTTATCPTPGTLDMPNPGPGAT